MVEGEFQESGEHQATRDDLGGADCGVAATARLNAEISELVAGNCAGLEQLKAEVEQYQLGLVRPEVVESEQSAGVEPDRGDSRRVEGAVGQADKAVEPGRGQPQPSSKPPKSPQRKRRPKKDKGMDFEL